MNIRLCKPEDLQIWTTLNREFMEFIARESEFWSDVEQTSDATFTKVFHEALGAPKLATLFLIEQDGEPIGYVTLQKTYSIWANGNIIIIDDLYIREEFRGQGIRTKAIEFIRDYTKKEDGKRLELKSDITNVDAKAFYKAIGFQHQEMNVYMMSME